jgi:hypothetical protein
VSITGAVDFICDIDGAASAIGDSNLALLLGFEIPDSVVVFRVLQQLIGCHGGHGGCVSYRVDGQRLQPGATVSKRAKYATIAIPQ